MADTGGQRGRNLSRVCPRPPAMPHPSLSSPNTTSRSSAPLASATCSTNMALFGIFFPPSAPVGRSLGAAGAGPRWRRQRGFEIIAMATQVKTVLGRPGLGLHISSQLQQVGPNTGLDVSHHSLGQTGHCCTFTTVRTIVLKLGLQWLLRLIISRSSRLCLQLKFLQVKL